MAVKADLLPDRYLEPRPIGRGGMGEIYLATDELLGRDVAIKTLSEPYAGDASVRERFTREALAAARLSGRPNIVTIFDVGEHRGTPYIVMEHLAGGTLEDRVREGPVPVGQALEWLEQAASALDGAHAEGVVHRATSSRRTCCSTSPGTCTSPTSGSRTPPAWSR
jgi:serine/threonine-protein kinase